MKKLFFKLKPLAVAAPVFLFFFFGSVFALARIYSISDTVSTSQPGQAATHTVSFKSPVETPAGGRIEIIPDPGEFSISPGMNYQNVEFEVGGEEQPVGPSPSADTSGVSIISGSSGRVVITLADNLTIPPDERVLVKVGTGNERITNPGSTGTHRVFVETYDDGGELIARANTVIAIIAPVAVSVELEIQEPLVYTREAQVSDMHNATLRGQLVHMGAEAYVEIFFQYRVSADQEWEDPEEEGEEGEEDEEGEEGEEDEEGEEGEEEEGETEGEGEIQTQEEEEWTETGLFGRRDPILFSESVGGLQKDTVYEFRAGVEWYDSEYEEYRRNYGEIMEFKTYADEVGEIPEEEDEPEEIEEGGPGDADYPGGTGPGPGGGSGPRPGGEPADPAPEEIPDPPPYLALRGWSYPGGEMTLTQNGEEVLVEEADSSASFNLELNDPLDGAHNFVLKAEDAHERTMYETSMTLEFSPNRGLIISGIYFPPSVELEQNAVSPDGEVEIYGESLPGSVVDIRFWKDEDVYATETVDVDSDGSWSYTIQGADFDEEGRYGVRVRGRHGREESSFSDTLRLTVGATGCVAADMTADGSVGLADFSIMMHHWGSDEPIADLNNDGVVDLVDFSILMDCWTG